MARRRRISRGNARGGAAALRWLVRLLWVVASLGTVEGSPIEALVARVDAQVIMLSDVKLAHALGVFADAPTPGAVLERLIDRALMLTEVERFQPPEPIASRIDDVIGTLRARAGDDVWQRILSSNGVDEAYVRALVRDNLRLETYAVQRFGASAEPTEEAVEAPTRERLRQERLAKLMTQWVTELRSRANIAVSEHVEGLLR